MGGLGCKKSFWKIFFRNFSEIRREELNEQESKKKKYETSINERSSQIVTAKIIVVIR